MIGDLVVVAQAKGGHWMNISVGVSEVKVGDVSTEIAVLSTDAVAVCNEVSGMTLVTPGAGVSNETHALDTIV